MTPPPPEKRRLVRSTNLGMRSPLKRSSNLGDSDSSRRHVNLRQHALSCHFASKSLLTTKSDTMKRIERINRLRELEAEIVACLCIALDRNGEFSLQRVLSDFLQYFESFYGDLTWIQGFSVEMVECLISDWLRTESDHIKDILMRPTMFECCPVGNASTIGKRSQMEDRSIIMHRLDEKYASKYAKLNKKHNFQVTSYIGVFDGHAGCVAAEYARVHLGCNIIKSISLWNPNSLSGFLEDFQFAINAGFSKTDDMFLNYAKELDLSSGTCASIAFIVDFNLMSTQQADGFLKSSPPKMNGVDQNGHRNSAATANGSSTSSINTVTTTPTRPNASHRRSDLQSTPLFNGTSTNQQHSKSPSELGRLIEQNQQSKRSMRVLITANIGDSKIVLSRSNTAIELSHQHKPDSEDEKERIEDAGGRVIWWMGQAKVNGVLGVSRAIGDAKLKNLIISKPHIEHRMIEDELDQFVIIASDGLWDVFSNQEAVDFVLQEMQQMNIPTRQQESSLRSRFGMHDDDDDDVDMDEASKSLETQKMEEALNLIAQKLTDEAGERKSRDNVTVNIIRL